MVKIVALVGVVGWLAVGGPMAGTPAAADTERTVVGIVEAADWDVEERVIAVALVAGDDEYFVVNDAKGRELIALVGRRVEVTGEVREDEDGFHIIQVKRFRVLD